MNEKRILLLTFVLLFALAFVSFGEVKAADWEFEETNVVISAGNWYIVNGSFSSSQVFSGFFETASETQGLDFFVCDAANLVTWESTGSATLYQEKYGYHYAGFQFTIPYGGEWCAVYSNRYGSSSVTVDIGADSLGDNSPYYDPSNWDHTEYAITLEPNEYYSLSQVYGAGSTISGHVSTWFSSDGIDVFFCDQANYNIFTSSGTPVRYGLEENYHQTPFGQFTVPYDGTWYVVFSAEGQADTVTISLGMDYTVLTTGASSSSSSSSSTSSESTSESSTSSTYEPTSSSSTTQSGIQLMLSPVIIGGIAILAIVVIGAVLCARRRPGPPPSPGGFEVVTPPPGPSTPRPESRPPVSEVGAKVLVICPYCGAKNEQGILKCQKCGADL